MSDENDNTPESDAEKVEALYELLTHKAIPDGLKHLDLPPAMTSEQAQELIWVLQNRLFLLPDNVVICDGCDGVFDRDETSVEWIESAGWLLCEDCYNGRNCFECCSCGAHDCQQGPGAAAIVAESIDGVKPGAYRVTRWPFYADGMITGYLYEDALTRLGDAPEGCDTNGYPMAFLCASCDAINWGSQPDNLNPSETHE